MKNVELLLVILLVIYYRFISITTNIFKRESIKIVIENDSLFFFSYYLSLNVIDHLVHGKKLNWIRTINGLRWVILEPVNV